MNNISVRSLYLFLTLLPIFISGHVFAAGEKATLMLSSDYQSCNNALDGEEKSCEDFSIPKKELNIELELWAQSEGSRIWAGSYRDRQEIGGVNINRLVVVFRAYAEDSFENSPVMNLVIATQAIGTQGEGEKSAVLQASARNLDDLQYVSIINSPTVISDKIFNSKLVVYGKNAVPEDKLLSTKVDLLRHLQKDLSKNAK